MMQKVSNKSKKAAEKENFIDILSGGFRIYLRICLAIILLLPTLLLTASVPDFTALDQSYLTSCAYSIPSGNYQLNSNINIDITTSIIVANGDVVIDLNGFDIKYRSTTIPIFVVQSGASLTIDNSKDSGVISNSGYCVYVENGSFILLGGTITTLSNSPCINIALNSSMTMSGGVVSSISSPCIENEGTFIKSGGTVLVGGTEENAVGGGGAINDETPDNGQITIGVDTDYPSVSYDISFPVITNLSLLRTETEDIKETPFEIKINKAQYLFDEREILISFSSDLLLTNTENNKTFPYTLEIGGQLCTTPSSPINLIISNPAIDTFAGKIIIDQKDIPAKGEYQAVIEYTISVQDK